MHSSSTRSVRRRVLTTASALTTVAAGVVIAAGSAQAAAPCPVGTDVGGGICQVIETSGSGATFSPPAGTTHLEALLVGGGGAGVNGYGGAGGDVKVVPLATTGAVTYSVGLGGTRAGSSASVVSQGALTTTALNGGGGNYYGSLSGSGLELDCSTFSNTNIYCAGAGAGALPASQYDGGAGKLVNAVETAGAAGTLFASDFDCYGGGGASGDSTPYGSQPTAVIVGSATCGGGHGTPTGIQSLSTQVTMSPTLPNSGGGGGSNAISHSQMNGADGVVVFRYTLVAAPSPVLNLNVVGGSHEVTGTWTGTSGDSFICTLMYGFGTPSTFTVVTNVSTCTFAGLAASTSYGISVVSYMGDVGSSPVVGLATTLPDAIPTTTTTVPVSTTPTHHVSANVYFATDKWILTTGSKTTLSRLASNAINYGITSLNVIGYADPRGNVAHNRYLSVQRANAVANFLRTFFRDHGVSVAVVAVGDGVLNISPNNALNRVVVVKG